MFILNIYYTLFDFQFNIKIPIKIILRPEIRFPVLL